jgi:hypothetical protein
MRRASYVVLWVAEVLAILAFFVALALPIQDYALREFIEWRQHPSSETYKAFIEKRREEGVVRLVIAAPFGIAAVFLGDRLRKSRKEITGGDRRKG